jgi:signal transduction histidine kinase/CheY-like chemotaxis protein
MADDLGFSGVLDQILENLNQVIPCTSACIFLFRSEGMRAVAARGQPDTQLILEAEYPADDRLSRQINESRLPVILNDARRESDFQGWGSTDYVRGWMGVPLIIRKDVIGYLSLDSNTINAFSDKEAKVAQAFANQAAITIENRRLFAETERLLNKTRKQADELGQIMDIVPDGIILLGENQRIIITNRSAKSYLSHFTDASVGDRLDSIGDLMISSLLRHQPARPSWRELTTSDQQSIFEVSARTLVGKGDEADCLIILRNVTEQRKEEDYLKAQERLATVGQLAAGIAHDFNNIMAVITLYTQLTMRTPELPAKDKQRLATVQQQAQRASDLIRQILDFSRQSVLDRKPIDLLPFLRDLVSSLQYAFPDDIDVRLNYEEGEYLVIADPNRIERALSNLAYNAREAMPDGGTLSLRLTSLLLSSKMSFPLPDISAGLWYVIEMTDSGMGFPREDLSHLFEPFFKTRPLGKRTGLGLAQVYGIIKQHDGFIDVESRVGIGTTFTIYIPAYETPVRLAPLPDFADLAQGHGETILIVEDEASTREGLADISRSLNYNVLTAANGLEALDKYEANNDEIDLIISDMIMPKMSGSELYDELKGRDSSIKMIILTGYPLEQGGQELLSQGIVDFIQKPVHVEDLAQAIYEALEKQV